MPLTIWTSHYVTQPAGIITSYRHCLIHKLKDSFSRQKMNAKKFFVSKCIIFSYYLCYMYYNIYGVEHVCSYMPIWFLHLWTCHLYWLTSMAAELYWIECLDEENEKCLSSALVLNASYNCRFWWELLWFRKIQNKVNL